MSCCCFFGPLIIFTFHVNNMNENACQTTYSALLSSTVQKPWLKSELNQWLRGLSHNNHPEGQTSKNQIQIHEGRRAEKETSESKKTSFIKNETLALHCCAFIFIYSYLVWKDELYNELSIESSGYCHSFIYLSLLFIWVHV